MWLDHRMLIVAVIKNILVEDLLSLHGFRIGLLPGACKKSLNWDKLRSIKHVKGFGFSCVGLLGYRIKNHRNYFSVTQVP